MADVHTPEARTRNMRAIRNKDTKPELLIRKGLHAAGFRYRLGGAGLPGRPDLVFPKYKIVIFIHGCFWHGHNCKFFKTPATRTEFWLEKINSNKSRDQKNIQLLLARGWNVIIVWECALKPMRAKLPLALGRISEILNSEKTNPPLVEIK